VRIMEDTINFGQYGLTILMTIVLMIVYKCVPKIPDRYKALIAVLVGMALGVVSIPYHGHAFTLVRLVDVLIGGLMAGASYSGLYELQRTVTKPRS